MCGIVGYLGNKKACPILVNGLKKLEYRGYDSAGICVLEKNTLAVKKDKGRVKNLETLDGINSLEGTLGIAHTRWATHGKPSKDNAHPHMDNSKTFAVVHNGIIENFKELREFLGNNNYKFYSETDSEVIPNLIHYYYSKGNNFIKSVNLACKDLKGSYALEIICKNEPDTLIVTRKDSPLVIGTSENGTYISSDIPALIAYTNNFCFLNDTELALITKNKIQNKLIKNFQMLNFQQKAVIKAILKIICLKKFMNNQILLEKQLVIH